MNRKGRRRMTDKERFQKLRKHHRSIMSRNANEAVKRKEIIRICEDYKSGTIGDMSDSFLVDCILDILEGEKSHD